MDLKMILIQMDNYSEFSRDAILEKLDRENNHLYIDSKIKEHQKIIGELQIKKQKTPGENSKEYKEFLEHWQQRFNEHDKDHAASDSNNIFWIKDKVMPAARTRGFRLNEKQLLEMFKAGRTNV